jgi:adenylosuccinate synthase
MIGQHKIKVVVGTQWGDEGKGKLIDLLSKDMDIVGRYNGGANAGHTIVVEDAKYAFHLVPSGVLYPHVSCLLGNGVVIFLPGLFSELKQLEERKIGYEGRFFISDRAHVLLQIHKQVDGLHEIQRGKEAIGTTRQGIGPCYATKMQRSGIRVSDLLHFDIFKDKLHKLVDTLKREYGDIPYDIDAEIKIYEELLPKIRPMIVDSVTYLHNAIKSGKHILVEGANANMLDIDFGTYPYVTSSSCASGGACTGLGVPPSSIGQTIGIVKAYTTRVGEGPFPTEELGDIGAEIRRIGCEFGTTTGRARRCGWLDIVQLKYSHMINGLTDIALTKIDVLSGFDKIKIGVKYLIDGKEIPSMPAHVKDLSLVQVEYITVDGWKDDLSKIREYEKLPENARKYIELIEKFLEVPITWIGVGPARDAIIYRNKS